MNKKLTLTAGAAALALLLGACGAPEDTGGTPTPQESTEAPTAPQEPEATHFDPPPPPEAFETDPEDPWGGLFTPEELEEVFLETVREEPSSPAIRATDDATLLAWGESVCPAVENGATFVDFHFPGLDPYLESPLIAGAAVGTWCPDLLEAAVGGDLDAVLDDYLES